MAFILGKNRIEYEEDGRMLAEITFPEIGEGIVDINSLFVDESLHGRDIADQLVERAAAELRHTNRKAVLSCSYAVKWFSRHAEYADVLKEYRPY